MQIYADSFYQPLLWVFGKNLWSFKTTGGQTAGCLKFIKHLFNSRSRELSWQPFTSPTQTLHVWHSSGPRRTVMYVPRQITQRNHSHTSFGSALIRGPEGGISSSIRHIQHTLRTSRQLAKYVGQIVTEDYHTHTRASVCGDIKWKDQQAEVFWLTGKHKSQGHLLSPIWFKDFTPVCSCKLHAGISYI